MKPSSLVFVPIDGSNKQVYRINPLFFFISQSLKAPTRGILIAFEGGDKSGKTTQSRHLVYLLNTVGKETKLLRFPDRSTDSGSVINMYLQGKVDFEPLHLHRLFARNRQEQKQKILDLLNNSGTNVIVDQMSPLLYYEDRGMPRPDLTFLLYLCGSFLESRLPPHPETGESRIFQEEVYRHYLHLLDPSYHMLDGEASELTIFAEVRRLALRAITVHSGKPLKYFE